MNGSPKKGAPMLANKQTLELSPFDIDDSDRIGFYHEDIAAALGRMMASRGQRDPIKVVRREPNLSLEEIVAAGRRPWGLVTGWHRLGGARIEGISILAIEVSGTTEELAEIQASENLDRRELGAIERAKFTAALVQAAKERLAREHGNLKQEQLAVKARWERVRAAHISAEKALSEETEDTCRTMRHVFGWEQAVGEALGVGRDTIHRDLRLYRLLIEPFPDLIEQLAQHPVVGDNRKQLAKLAGAGDEANRRKIIEMLLSFLGLDFDGAVERLNGHATKPQATPTNYSKFSSQATGAFGRLNISEKRRFIEDDLIGMLRRNPQRSALYPAS